MKPISGMLSVQGIQVAVRTYDGVEDYISLTDIARYRSAEPKDVVKNWLRSRETIEFLGLWERLHNPEFKGVEFDSLRQASGSNTFVLSPKKWIELTGAIGIKSSAGKNGGTFAHHDIALQFATWLAPELQLYILMEYQKFKKDDAYKNAVEWNMYRDVAKLGYRIHTDAVKASLPEDLTQEQATFAYSSEADILNVALFGMTAAQWRRKNPDLSGNIRDNANMAQLIVLNILEGLNAELLKQGFPQAERIAKLRDAAVLHLRSVSSVSSVRALNKK